MPSALRKQGKILGGEKPAWRQSHPASQCKRAKRDRGAGRSFWLLILSRGVQSSSWACPSNHASCDRCQVKFAVPFSLHRVGLSLQLLAPVAEVLEATLTSVRSAFSGLARLRGFRSIQTLRRGSCRPVWIDSQQDSQHQIRQDSSPHLHGMFACSNCS